MSTDQLSPPIFLTINWIETSIAFICFVLPASEFTSNSCEGFKGVPVIFFVGW